MANRKNRQNERGFTLSEVLLTVAILAVLSALAIIPIGRMQRELRQTELDAKAEILFQTAQNRLTQLQAAGTPERYQKGCNIAIVRGEEQESGYVYIDNSSSAAGYILPEGQVEEELRSHYWVVEYDKDAASVYAVFYSEKPMTDYGKPEFEMNRFRSRRLADGAVVGYYSGATAESGETGKLELKDVGVTNGERLLVNASCKAPGLRDELAFYVTIKDGLGGSTTLTPNAQEKEYNDGVYSFTLVLDDLSGDGGLRFARQTRLESLSPGSDLTITVEVRSKNNPMMEPASITLEKTNSLFAAVEEGGKSEDGYTALIACGRHLQNLEKAAANGRTAVFEKIKRAEQTQDIDFARSGEDGWRGCYGARNFTPIQNDYLKEYESVSKTIDGSEFVPVISNLTVAAVAENGDAGLFESFSGTSLKNIRLSGAEVRGSGKIGALAGSVSGRVSGSVLVEGCHVYLSSEHLTSTNREKHWLTGGSYTGGLIGYVNSEAQLTIRSSLAATVADGASAAGGLLGYVENGANVQISHSYADCYLYSGAKNGCTGGLIGTSGGNTGVATSPIKLENCYAAGFQQARVTAGLSAGRLYRVANSYTACAPLEGGSLTYSTTLLHEWLSTDKVYYLSDGVTNLEGRTDRVSWTQSDMDSAAGLLGDAFTSQTAGRSYPYNLRVTGLTSYTYPRLKNLSHYGDWKVDFLSGSLAYYEHYDGDIYGLWVAGLDDTAPLRDDLTVLGDGYGVIYDQKPTENVTVIYDGKTSCDLDKDHCISISTGMAGKTYYLLKLPKELVNPELDKTDFYHKLTIGSETCYYNPYFANAMLPSVTDGILVSSITIRTARQLHALGQYYGDFAAKLDKNGSVLQGRSISYGSYCWEDYGKDGKRPATQLPIGTEEKPFRHTYIGGCFRIEGAPLAGQSGNCIGLFGWNNGTLRDIVLLADEKEKKVSFQDGVHTMRAYAGALVGRNDGRVENCAAADYEIEAVVSGSELYVGGLIGQNAGTVDSCGVSSPSVKATSYHAQLRIGGFVGSNNTTGRIDDCYAMAAVSVPDSRDGKAVLGGFAGENQRLIRSAYCATALDAAEEAKAYGFALSTDGGGVSGCYYVDGSTYYFAGKNHLFNCKDSGSKANATAIRSDALESRSEEVKKLSDKFQKVRHTYGADGDYPYLAVVKDAYGELVHYGEWVSMVNAGELGMFYWEHEVGGANEGYHISYIGFTADGEKRTGSSLCVSHDDGGVITEYGYGYYWETAVYGDSEQPVMGYRVTASNSNNGFSLGEEQSKVNEELRRQMPKYTFVSYQTGADGLHMQSTDAANGVWLLTSKKGTTFAYALCPFFADSFTYLGENMNEGEAVQRAAAFGKATDGTFYQIRSVEQLQFINWSWYDGKGSTNLMVESSADTKIGVIKYTEYTHSKEYMNFPYLQYATVLGKSGQSRAKAENKRPARSWKQTHDLNGANREYPSDGTKNTMFHPIAGAIFYNQTEKPENEGYAVSLYNWFGGIYDGDNYYIKNINVKSPCYNVGIFGTTAGAQLRNIVLYSDNGGTVERSTETAPYNGYRCAYALGGLVGIAYDYLYDSTGKKVEGGDRATITNCAIAGYKIEDNSTNPLQLGEAVVGGLIGVSKVNLNSCSAVVDIAVNCTHRKSDDRKSADWNKLTAAQYGNYIRVGGMVGGVQYMVTNCYTGGSIKIGADTLNERVKDGSLVPVKDSKTEQAVDGTAATYVYIGGIGGSGFSSNFRNFTWKDGTDDGQPLYENCYTYVEFPTMEGTIMAISRIGSIADRYGQSDAKLTIKNCYYLKSEIAYNLPKYYVKSEQRGWGGNSYYYYFSLHNILTDGEKESMLNGDLSYVNYYFSRTRGDQRKYTIDNLAGLTYQQLAGKEDIGGGERILALLNGTGETFHMVTTKERGTPVYGKYSFPGDTAEVQALKGQDYPFPTVLQQKNAFGDTVFLHYGRWPVQGLAWGNWTTDGSEKQVFRAESEKSIDLITEEGKGSISLAMVDVKTEEISSAAPVLTYSTPGVFKEIQLPSGTLKDKYTVELTAERLGSTWITATMDGYTTHLLASVTALVDIVVTQGENPVEAAVTMPKNNTWELQLTAKNKNEETLDVVWSIDSDFREALEAEIDGEGKLTLKSHDLTGEVTLRLTATYQKGEASYTGERSLTVTIVE